MSPQGKISFFFSRAGRNWLRVHPPPPGHYFPAWGTEKGITVFGPAATSLQGRLTPRAQFEVCGLRPWGFCCLLIMQCCGCRSDFRFSLSLFKLFLFRIPHVPSKASEPPLSTCSTRPGTITRRAMRISPGFLHTRTVGSLILPQRVIVAVPITPGLVAIFELVALSPGLLEHRRYGPMSCRGWPLIFS